MTYPEYRQALIAYRTSMSIAKEMLSQGIITPEDYAKIDRKIAENHGLNLSQIWGRNG